MQVNEHFKKYTIFFCTSKEQPNINVQKFKKKSEKTLNLIGKKRFCTCNKSQCNKKYCECFSKGKKCNENFCSCSDCHNKMNLNKNYEIKLEFLALAKKVSVLRNIVNVIIMEKNVISVVVVWIVKIKNNLLLKKIVFLH